MKRVPVLRKRTLLIVTQISTFFLLCAMFDGAFGVELYQETETSTLSDYCASGCNISGVDPYKNTADGLFGISGGYQFITRYTTANERPYSHYAVPLNVTRGEIIPESLRLDFLAWGYSNECDNSHIIISPDNETWFSMNDSDSVCEVKYYKDVLTDFNLSSPYQLMEFINSSDFFNIYITLNTTVAGGGQSFAGFNLTADLYNTTERILTNCSNPDHLKSQQFDAYDEGTFGGVVNWTTTQADFFFDLPNGTERAIPLTYGYNISHFVCVYPSEENFTVDMDLRYLAPNYTARYWYFNNVIFDNETDLTDIYLLNETQDDAVVFRVQNPGKNPLANVLITVLRQIGTEWITVTQKRTDYTGIATVNLDVSENYLVFFNSAGYVTEQLDLSPSLLDYTISMTQLRFNNIFDDVAYLLVPWTLSVRAEDWINLTIVSFGEDLEYWGLNVTYINGTCLNCQHSTDAEGGSFENDFATDETSIQVIPYFKRSNYDEWSITKNFFVQNWTSGTNSLISIFTGLDSSVIPTMARDFIYLTVTAIASVKLGGAGLGGGLMALIILGLGTGVGWFSLNLFILMCLSLGAIGILLVIGK